MPNIDDELRILQNRFKIFKEANNNPILALANYPGSAEALEEFFNLMHVNLTAEFTHTYEENFSIIERVLKFLYKLFGAEYQTADINGLDQHGNGPLHYTFGSVDVMKLLVDKCGADINLPNNIGETAIMKAAEYGMADSVAYLLDKGASIDNITTNEQKNILHKLAIEFKPRDKEGQLDAVKLLMQSDAAFYKQLNARDKHGMTPIDYARKNQAHCAGELIEMFNTKINTDVTNATKLVQGAYTQRVVADANNNNHKDRTL